MDETISVETNLGGAVPAFAFGRGSVDLDELSQVHAIAQRSVDGERIGRKAIGGQLVGLRGGRKAQALDKRIGGLLIALA